MTMAATVPPDIEEEGAAEGEGAGAAEGRREEEGGAVTE